MIIYERIKDLIKAGSSDNGLIYDWKDIRTFKDFEAEYFEAKNYEALFELSGNGMYSYTLIEAYGIKNITIAVMVHTYEKGANGIHIFRSFGCDMIEHPEDLESIVSYLKENDYREISPFEFATIGQEMVKLDERWNDHFVFCCEDDLNINIICEIPNQTYGYVPNEHDQDSPVPDNTPEYDEER